MNKKKKWKVESLLSGALALLGFTGCNSNSEAPCLYGTPSVNYQVLGTVTDEQGKPLKDIQVVVADPYTYNYYDDNGNLIVDNVCIGTCIDSGTYEHYIGRPRIKNDLHGMGAFVLMCAEMEKYYKE